MRTLALVAVLLSVASGLRAQGTVNFANGAAGVNAPVTDPTTGQPLQGAAWQAELLLVAADGSWAQIGGSVPFQTQAVAGYFLGGLVVVPGVEAGGEGTFRVRVTATNSSTTALSQPVTVKLGGEKMPPANLVGLQGWVFTHGDTVPTLGIALSGDQVTLWWPKLFASFALQTTPNLKPPDWSLVTLPRATNADVISVRLPLASSAQYFRLRSE
jgi:hypothetical protein